MNIFSKIVLLVLVVCTGCVEQQNNTPDTSLLVDIGSCLSIKDDFVRSQCEIQAVEDACIEKAETDCDREPICVLMHAVHCPIILPQKNDYGSS